MSWWKSWGASWGASWGDGEASNNVGSSSGAAPSQQQPQAWPRPRVRIPLMVSVDGHAHASGVVSAETRYPIGSKSPGAPRSAWALPTGANGHTNARGALKASCVKAARAHGHASATYKATASVWQDDAAEILALVVALDRAHMECVQ